MGSNDTSASDKEKLREEIERLQDELDSLKASMPAHSLSPAMMQRTEDLEADIEHKQSMLDEKASDEEP